MKKIIWIPILLLLAVIIGLFIFVKVNPPLDISNVYASGDYKSAIVGVGNTGFADIKIVDVTVNNDEKPLDKKIQVSHALQGFIATEDYYSKDAEKYGFTNLEDVIIKTGTSPSIHFEKLDNGTATKEDLAYGVSALHSSAINEMKITYKYLGITFTETVTVTPYPIINEE